MTDEQRKAACERAINAVLSQFNCVLVPTIARDSQNNLFPDQMTVRVFVLPAKETVAPEPPQADTTGFVDPAALVVEPVLNGAGEAGSEA